jgi:pimeloyl-ACP methyl ester carboxylesterase
MAGKKDLFLLHGALGDKGQFDALIAQIEHAFTIHTLDFEGHGAAPLKNRHLRFEFFMENVISYMDAHDLARVDIFGYSMGGAVGLFLASRHPRRVRRLLTLATKFNWNPQIAAKETRLLDAEKIELKVPQFAKTLKERHTAAGWKHLLERTKEFFTHIGSNPPLGASDYGMITTPVRVCVGDRDQMVSIEETLEVYRSLANGQLQVFPETGHPLEKFPMPVLAEVLLSFFREAMAKNY